MKEEIVKHWIKETENDWKFVKNLLKTKDPPVDILCFHCQQSI